jgi:GntR family transcriptional regulator, uxu operon transcriptional repressor
LRRRASVVPRVTRHRIAEVIPLPLQLVEPKRLYRQIADQLAQLIARGEFPAGTRLPAERELAASFGVSRASVREAIISLEMNGLVDVRVGTGIFVAPQPDSVSRAGGDAGPGPFELLAARKLVEGEIAALAAKNATPASVAALRESVGRIEANLNEFALREAEDRDFHLLLAKATGNGSLELVVEGLWNQRAELWGRLQQHFHTAALAERTIRDHAAIAAAIEAKNPDAARAAMHRHLARVTREFQRGVDNTAQPEQAGAAVTPKTRRSRGSARR